MPPVRHPCEDARHGTSPSWGSRRNECLRPPRLMSTLRAVAPESYRRRYRSAFVVRTPHDLGPRDSRTANRPWRTAHQFRGGRSRGDSGPSSRVRRHVLVGADIDSPRVRVPSNLSMEIACQDTVTHACAYDPRYSTTFECRSLRLTTSAPFAVAPCIEKLLPEMSSVDNDNVVLGASTCHLTAHRVRVFLPHRDPVGRGRPLISLAVRLATASILENNILKGLALTPPNTIHKHSQIIP